MIRSKTKLYIFFLTIIAIFTFCILFIKHEDKIEINKTNDTIDLTKINKYVLDYMNGDGLYYGCNVTEDAISYKVDLAFKLIYSEIMNYCLEDFDGYIDLSYNPIECNKTNYILYKDENALYGDNSSGYICTTTIGKKIYDNYKEKLGGYISNDEIEDYYISKYNFEEKIKNVINSNENYKILTMENIYEALNLYSPFNLYENYIVRREHTVGTDYQRNYVIIDYNETNDEYVVNYKVYDISFEDNYYSMNENERNNIILNNGKKYKLTLKKANDIILDSKIERIK